MKARLRWCSGSRRKCRHRHHQSSPSFNGGTIVIDSSSNGDEMLANGRSSYMTHDSKAPLLGPKQLSPEKVDTLKMINKPYHVMVLDDHQSIDINDSRHGVMNASSNSTTSSSAGACSIDGKTSRTVMMGGPPSNPNSQPSTFRPIKHPGPPTLPRTHQAPQQQTVMTQSWHADTMLISDGNNSFHLPNCHQLRQQQQMPPPPPPPAVESDVVVKLLPALSAASSLAEFLGHSNEHIEVVPEQDEEEAEADNEDDSIPGIDSDNNDDGNHGMDDEERREQLRREERRRFMQVLQSDDQRQLQQQQQQQQQQQYQDYQPPVLSSSQHTAIFHGNDGR